MTLAYNLPPALTKKPKAGKIEAICKSSKHYHHYQIQGMDPEVNADFQASNITWVSISIQRPIENYGLE